VKYIRLVFYILIILFSLFFYFSIKWLDLYYKGISIEQIIFHIRMPLEGTGKELLISYYSFVIKPVFIIIINYICLMVLLNKYNIHIKTKDRNIDFSAVLIKEFTFIINILSVILLLITIDKLVYQYDFINYFKNTLDTTDFYEKEYINPASVKYNFPEKKRNLILIFLESIESTFFSITDGGSFNEEIIPELKKLARENIHFSNTQLLGGAYQVSGTGWTVGALVGHTLGIPLNIPIHGNAYEGYKTFLPGAIGLTDILAQAGYQQRFLIGSDKKFAGRDTLFQTHGNVIIKDYNHYKDIGKIPNDYHVWWGFEDEKLFLFAQEELQELAKSNQPFNLMLLTVDTHHVGGYICRLCKNEFSEQYKNVLRCASKQVYNFVKWVQSQPWYENTTIVITGDHFYMDGTFIPLNARRSIYNVYINSVIEPKEKNNRIFSAFDTLPSILDCMGIQYNANGLALGRSLFRNTKTLLEIYDISYLNSEIIKKSKVYESFLYRED